MTDVQFLQDTKEASIPSASIEEGVVQDRNGRLFQRSASSRLSAVSKKYDVDGDGKLDEAEQAMRDMDKEGRGYLTNDKVLTVFQEQLRVQKQLLLAKRLVIFFAVMLVILAVANIGVAFAAARLAQDTSTQNNVLVVKDTGEIVSTNNHADIFGIKTSVDTERRRVQVTGDGETNATSTFVSLQDAEDMYTECASRGVSVKLNRTWDGYDDLEDVIEICPGMSYDKLGQDYIYVLMSGRNTDNKVITVTCAGGADPCSVTGNGLLQTVGEPCVYDSDCDYGSICHGATETTAGSCKMPLGSDCWLSSECSTNTCHFGQAYGAVGACVCNSSTDNGCDAGKTCASSNDQFLATGIVDVGPRCYVPLDGDCTADSDCLTGVCDSVCVCNGQNYPCADGETCIAGACQI